MPEQPVAVLCVPGIILSVDKRGRHIAFAPNLGVETFVAFLEAMLQEGLEFAMYDPSYPSPSDPGAYLSYSPSNGEWRMTLGNHGWTGGIYTVAAAVIAKQLFSLYAQKVLDPLDLDGVAFFKSMAPKSSADNAEINARLTRLHGG